MSKYFRYPTVIRKDDSYYLILNINHGHKGDTIIDKIDDLPEVYNLNKNKKVIINDKIVVHNFTVFPDKTDKFYYGMGGLIRDQKPYMSKKFRYFNKKNSGIFLYKSLDFKKWKKINNNKPIISAKNHPKNPVIGIESKCPQFDSNICCMYSNVIGKYILYCRANIKKGCRSVQYTTTKDFKKWSPFKLLYINSFRKNENYYMFKCVELGNYKIFFGLAPYTNKAINPTKHYIKKLVSSDGKKWADFGKLCDAKMHTDKIHVNTHIADIIYKNNNLEIILFVDCFNKKSKLKKYIFKINNKEPLLDFINNLKIS